MSTWLDPVRHALDALATPVAVFVRDDDAGWDDPALARLLGVCAAHRAPIDLAVIPAALDDERAAWLLARRDAHPVRLGLHQHGWAHANHEPDGVRKCEFGSARPLADLHHDLAKGRAVLRRLLGATCDPIFTPPWNRCVAGMGPLLTSLGIQVLSRDATATPLHSPGLRECPTDVDWSNRTLPGREARAQATAGALSSGPVTGLLLHHAAMDADVLRQAGDLLGVLTAHPAVRLVSLLEAAATTPAEAPVPGTAMVSA